MSNPKIKDIKVIFTEPDNIRLVIVKILTDQDGLYGVGCATFTQRPNPVKSAIEDYLKPFLIGAEVNNIEDIWQSSYVSSYWRNGPVLNNALSYLLSVKVVLSAAIADTYALATALDVPPFNFIV